MTGKVFKKQWLAQGCFRAARLWPTLRGPWASQEDFYFFSFFACQNSPNGESP
ncbi:hypothetical protein RHECNPAF_850068 [Rhizobium etli CNPAF512]|nr:hypothetical protein RHECNPAF_850068 [Rhizobium etli CNPAF512]